MFSKQIQYKNKGNSDGGKSLPKPPSKVTGRSAVPQESLAKSGKKARNHPFKWYEQNIEIKFCKCRDLKVFFTRESTEDSCVTNCRIVCKSASLTAMKLMF